MPIESDKHNAPESAAEQSEKLSSAADLSNAGNLQKGKAEANPSTARNYLPSLEIENRSGADKNERSPSSEGHPDYKKELGDKQVLLAANLTHGDNLALIPKLSEIIDQLKDAKPPIATLGLEGFPSSWNEDFRKYMGDPSNKEYQEKVKEHLHEYAQHVSPDPTKQAELERGLLAVVEKAQEAGLQIVGLEAPVPLDQHSGESQNWMLPASAIKSVLEDYKGPNGESGADLLRDYNSKDKSVSQRARERLYSYLSNLPGTFQQEVDASGNLVPLSNATDNATAARDALAALDQMKEHGFFDNGFFENPPVNQKGFDKDAFQEQLQSWRSRVMAENIAKHLNKGRVIVSVGEGHLPHNPKGYKSIDEYLKRMGFEPKDLRF